MTFKHPFFLFSLVVFASIVFGDTIPASNPGESSRNLRDEGKLSSVNSEGREETQNHFPPFPIPGIRQLRPLALT